MNLLFNLSCVLGDVVFRTLTFLYFYPLFFLCMPKERNKEKALCLMLLPVNPSRPSLSKEAIAFTGSCFAICLDVDSTQLELFNILSRERGFFTRRKSSDVTAGPGLRCRQCGPTEQPIWMECDHSRTPNLPNRPQWLRWCRYLCPD